ncbi:unnamed protein product [Moneuplotes crassus]|uniref:Uncharacterized protein n=1 Tax=Euplotes crassus TaxID=5936 RepID=A0AAD1XLA9_EUPCR|nr:unnamed protein product [Moneuplotes crassus]
MNVVGGALKLKRPPNIAKNMRKNKKDKKDKKDKKEKKDKKSKKEGKSKKDKKSKSSKKSKKSKELRKRDLKSSSKIEEASKTEEQKGGIEDVFVDQAEDFISTTKKTAAELRFEEIQKQRRFNTKEGKTNLLKSHREKVQDYVDNYLEKMTDTFDIPKVGPG